MSDARPLSQPSLQLAIEIAARPTRAYARRLTAGSRGVGCWRGDEGQREHFFGGLVEVAAPDA